MTMFEGSPDPRNSSDGTERGRERARAELPERSESLWMLTGGPAVWALHFLACYVTAAVWCAKVASRADRLGGTRVAMAAYTMVALALIAYFGWRGLRQHSWGSSKAPHDQATAADRHRFLGFSTMLLCGLSFVAVVYVAFAVALIGTCR
jgi:hypothetical protein